MASYWIIVPRGNMELFALLSVAFRGRTGFNVIVDRRSATAPTAEGDRRTTELHPGPDEIVIAEQTGQVDRSELPMAGARRQARRRIYRRRPGTDSGKTIERGTRPLRHAAPLPAGR